MISAVYGHDGKPLAKAEQWGTLRSPKSISPADLLA